jgi:hypothetical protein
MGFHRIFLILAKNPKLPTTSPLNTGGQTPPSLPIIAPRHMLELKIWIYFRLNNSSGLQSSRRPNWWMWTTYKAMWRRQSLIQWTSKYPTSLVFECSLCVRKWNGNRTTIKIPDIFAGFWNGPLRQKKYIPLCIKRSRLAENFVPVFKWSTSLFYT